VSAVAAAQQEEKDKLIEAVLKVLRMNPRFSKIEERNVKRILRKLDLEDLVYLANVFDVFAEWLSARERGQASAGATT
jgi:hypothetical protein